ncbi:MAG: TonB-dependent receptor, partial [Pseudomonadota bacterium]|nr:TonB-dependent receptor [Pseudomonadota bacterium]
QGQTYAEASYVTTLSFVQKDGLVSPALPEPPTKGH